MQIRCHSDRSEESVRAGGTRSDIRARLPPTASCFVAFSEACLDTRISIAECRDMKATRFIALAAAFVIVSAVAQSTSDEDSKPIEETHKNIKVLKGIPTRDLIPMMALISNSLGVTCTHCHVDKQWELDDKDEKGVARSMIVMVRDINDRNFAGEQAVTCMTCHQGHITPPTIPRLADAGWNKKPEATKPAPALPTIDAVIAKYIDALGGANAIANVKSRVERGTVTRESGREEPKSSS